MVRLSRTARPVPGRPPLASARRVAVCVAAWIAAAPAAAQGPAPDGRGLFDPPRPAAGAGPVAPGTDGPGADALRRDAERERAAREFRVGPLPPPPVVPRIQPDAPPALVMPPPPRIAIPRAGEPGGPPIVLPSCGPAGCVDADGRPMPSAGGNVLIGPGGRPCLRVGSTATC